jgi:hypothetical protein
MSLQLTDVIRIEAAVDAVWAVTVDVERWPEWTPTVTAVARIDDGPLRPGSVARLTQPMQRPALWEVTALEPGRRFAWQSRRPGLRFVATHELEPDGSGTENTLRVEAGGIMAGLLWPLLRPALRRALAAENLGLKRRCEAS